MPYRTVTRWVKAFNDGLPTVEKIHRAIRPTNVSEEEVHALAVLLDSDRNQTIWEFVQETGLAHTAVLCILKERSSVRKIGLA